MGSTLFLALELKTYLNYLKLLFCTYFCHFSSSAIILPGVLLLFLKTDWVTSASASFSWNLVFQAMEMSPTECDQECNRWYYFSIIRSIIVFFHGVIHYFLRRISCYKCVWKDNHPDIEDSLYKKKQTNNKTPKNRIAQWFSVLHVFMN